ncbi:MAG: aminotransferase class V-fold PLP-dependent enzyme [Terriglobales bacterium]
MAFWRVEPGPSFSQHFASFHSRAWLNCAQQGPLPKAAVRAALGAVADKARPFRMSDDRYAAVPRELKARLARLIGAGDPEIVLGNSASYGVQVIANGLDWRVGDEVLLLRGDFPATTLPWQVLERRGVVIRWLEPRGAAPRSEELAAALGAKTRLFCASWVNSFTGAALDLTALGECCRRQGVLFVVNASQALGALTLDVSRTPVDAVSCCGYKWLCGPYGSGFAWLSPRLLASIQPTQVNWFAAQQAALAAASAAQGAEAQGGALNHMRDLTVPAAGMGAAGLDVFDTANFFNFVPWTAALDVLLACGPARVAAHDRDLVARLLAVLDRVAYHVRSPEPPESAIAVLSHRQPGRNAAIHAALAAAGVDISLREGNLRLSPHFYNTPEDIARATAELERLA